MKADDYHEADFIALYPEEGGFVQKLLSDSGKAIVDRISSALGPAMDRVLQEGEEVSDSLQQQVTNRKNQIENGVIEPSSFQYILENPGNHVVRGYADRSINREIDQVLSMIRSQSSGDSLLEITAEGSRTEKYQFNRFRSVRFHSIISKRQIGEPVIYVARIRQLDRQLLNGKIVNQENDKTLTIRFADDSDFLKAHPYLGNNDEMVFIGAPIIEYGAFDPNAGDIYFIDLMGS
ncbi:hypothetical protein [Marinospirillum celere]|nr:hypothetical protein [Marinospirillum celere]